jgi:purine nucleosidase
MVDGSSHVELPRGFGPGALTFFATIRSVPRPFFIDTDTASDDAVALVMALRHPDVDVVGIGVVAGNVPLDQAVQNALYVAELCGADVPIHAGADRPLVVPLETAQFVHGVDGMGDIGLPLTGRSPTPGHAVDALLAASHRYSGELTLVTLGPLTNIAIAVRRDPALAARVGRCVVMGGVADHIGNLSPVAEYNMWADPHAVAVVLEAGLPLELVGWDISRQYAVLDPDDAAALRAIGTPLAEMCVDVQQVLTQFALAETKLAGFDLPDPIAMAYAIDPTVAIAARRVHCAVETESPLTRGMVVMDLLGLTDQEPNALVVTEANRSRFQGMLRDAVK